MKRNQCSLLCLPARTMLLNAVPLSAVLLFFAPSVVSAQTQPTTATTTTTVDSTTTNTTQPATSSVSGSIPSSGTSAALLGNSTQPTTSVATSTTPTTLPVQASMPSASPAPVYIPIAIPAQYGYPGYPNGYPTGYGTGYPSNVQGGYPIPMPGTYPAGVPVQAGNSNGFKVNVTTSIDVPGQVGYPGGVYPQNPGVYPQAGIYPQAVTYPQTGIYPQGGIYPPGVTYPQTIYPVPGQSTYPSVGFGQGTSGESLLQLAQSLVETNRTQEAITVLQQAVSLYPTQAELARSLMSVLGKSNRWAEAATVARQFALRNPTSALAGDFTKLADEALRLAQTSTQSSISTINTSSARNSLLSKLLNGGLGYLLNNKGTSANAGLSLPWTSQQQSGQSSWTSLQGQSTTGSQLAQDLLNKVQLVNDAEVVNYVNDIGRKLAIASGRSDPYEFYVVKDQDTSALALPGCKIFVSAGAIAKANSESALATLIARQMGHSLLSHPTKLANRSNFTSTLSKLLPVVGGLVSPKLGNLTNGVVGNVVTGLMGNLVSGLVKPNYTSQMINQADQVGSKLLNAAGYGQGNLINISTSSDRYAQIKARVQQLLEIS